MPGTCVNGENEPHCLHRGQRSATAGFESTANGKQLTPPTVLSISPQKAEFGDRTTETAQIVLDMKGRICRRYKVAYRRDRGDESGCAGRPV
ncbi:hypothetical protein AOLI_G00316970 [Acnodon oligacanthus]